MRAFYTRLTHAFARTFRCVRFTRVWHVRFARVCQTHVHFNVMNFSTLWTSQLLNFCEHCKRLPFVSTSTFLKMDFLSLESIFVPMATLGSGGWGNLGTKNGFETIWRRDRTCGCSRTRPKSSLSAFKIKMMIMMMMTMVKMMIRMKDG